VLKCKSIYCSNFAVNATDAAVIAVIVFKLLFPFF